MTNPQDDFNAYLKEQLSLYGSVMVPVKASLFNRIIHPRYSPFKLHPNPEDEFCDPSIGPNYGIITSYANHYTKYENMKMGDVTEDSRLMVEKVRPDGYMILNGHHRWAAGLRLGLKTLPIKIVNLTQEEDVEQMLKASKHEKRVSLDLDEVIFADSTDTPTEKPLGFPFSLRFKERIRRGVPALLVKLASRGYDIWVYTAGYDSMDHVQALLKHYGVATTGVITGIGRRGETHKKVSAHVQSMLAETYRETLHIDAHTILRINNRTKEFEEYEISGEADWAESVKQILAGIADNA